MPVGKSSDPLACLLGNSSDPFSSEVSTFARPRGAGSGDKNGAVFIIARLLEFGFSSGNTGQAGGSYSFNLRCGRDPFEVVVATVLEL